MSFLWRVAWVGLCLACTVCAVEPFSAGELAARRLALTKSAHEDVIILIGAQPAEHPLFPFRQSNSFYYLTGWNEPGAVAVLLRREGGLYDEFLFLPNRDKRREIWDGPRTGPTDKRAVTTTGIANVLPKRQLQSFFAARNLRRPHIGWAGSETAPDWIADRLRPRKLEPIEARIDKLRSVKSPAELDRIRRAAAASIAAHRTAWRTISPGQSERAVAGMMLSEIFAHGCWRPAYAPIVGAGRNATTLHYNALTARIEPGDVVLMDVGGEYGHYAADITRTVPVSGRFTERQRAIYEIVLAAHDAALRAARPGIRLGGSGSSTLHSIARGVLDSLGRQRLGQPLGESMIHGIGHHVGLAVHDPTPASAKLSPGMVITIEPGVYLPAESLGIRIENMVLITRDGAENLSAALPTDPSAIESLLASDAAESAASPLK